MQCGKYSQRAIRNAFSAYRHGKKGQKRPKPALSRPFSLIFCGYLIDSVIVKSGKFLSYELEGYRNVGY